MLASISHNSVHSFIGYNDWENLEKKKKKIYAHQLLQRSIITMGITMGKGKKTQNFSFDLKNFFKRAHISLIYRWGIKKGSLCFKFFNFVSIFWRKLRFGFLPLQWSSIVMAKNQIYIFSKIYWKNWKT